MNSVPIKTAPDAGNPVESLKAIPVVCVLSILVTKVVPAKLSLVVLFVSPF